MVTKIDGTLGVITPAVVFPGSPSGSITLTAPVGSGSYNIQLPANNGQVILADPEGTIVLTNSGGGSVTLKPATGTSNTTFTFPNSNGTAGYFLTTNGSGVTSWVSGTPTGVITFSGGTTGLTPLAPTGGVVTLGGTLAVANGGTGVTSSTGSGSVVLSTSPTLITPALGIPSSGTLTNCTGLPLTTGVTGTLAIGNGGTGVTSSTGSGSLVLSTSPSLVTPDLGTPSNGTLTNCTGLPLMTGVTGTLAVINGGTGQSSYTIGDLLYASSTTALSKLPDAATGNALISGGVGAPPSWGKVGLTTHVSGTLPLANGGTGVTSLSALQTSIFPSQSGNSGKYLTTNGSTTSWAGSGQIPLFYDLITDLRSVTPTAGTNAVVGGYYADGDGGGGEFYGVIGASPGTYVDNGGTIIVPTGGDGSAAWLRVSEPFVDVTWFGARGDAKSVTGNVSITSGDNVLTVTGAGFTAADFGKTISVPAALGTIQANSAQKPSLNTGTGTMSPVTTLAGVVAGNYTVTFTSATAFTVTNPSGTTVGTGSVGSPFSIQVGFTITAGGTAFVAGDAFIINVFFNSLITTISEYVSATQVKLAANAGATLSASSRVVTWGTENATPFTNAIASLSKTGSKLIISAGVYLTSARPLYFLDMSNFVVDGYGATIKFMDGITPSDATRIIEARRCKNFTINGLVLDGNRANRPSVLLGFLFSMQKCINFTLNNVGAINGTIDGYYIAGEPGQSANPTYYSENFLINNCYADNNARQGMSIINANDYTITGGYFSRTNGASPQAGIDVEANAPFPASLPANARGRFYGVMFESNSGLGLLITAQGSTEDFIVEGCQFIGNQNGGANIGANNSWVRNCVFRDNVNAANLQGALQTTKFVTLTNGGFIGNKFVNNTNTISDIYVAAETSNFIVDGNVSENSSKAGILAAGPSTTITNNIILNAPLIGINSASTAAVISGNKLSGCASRGIYSAANNVHITNNIITDCNALVAGYIQSASGDNVIIADNIMSATTLQATTRGVLVSAGAGLLIRNNICQNLHTTDPYSYASATVYSVYGNVGAGNDNRTVKHGFAMPSYTTAARPAANLVAAGQMIFNTTTNKVNVSDGAAWWNADGTAA